jgi:hypothetical protein
VEKTSKSNIMKTSQGFSSVKGVKSPVPIPNYNYMGYLTQKQLHQLYKFKKDQDSDKESYVSGHSNKGRRTKLRLVQFDIV